MGHPLSTAPVRGEEAGVFTHIPTAADGELAMLAPWARPFPADASQRLQSWQRRFSPARSQSVLGAGRFGKPGLGCLHTWRPAARLRGPAPPAEVQEALVVGKPLQVPSRVAGGTRVGHPQSSL